MSPRAGRRNALILIPLSIGVGIVAVVIGNWPVLAFMVLSVGFQVATLVMNRRRLGRRD
jgi:uncharacterized membrane protein